MTCRPILYTFEADTHCTPCALERFGNDGLGHVPGEAEDSEGNEPGVLASWDTWEQNTGEYGDVTVCGTCRRLLCTSCGTTADFETAEDGRATVKPDKCWNCRSDWRSEDELWEACRTAAQKEGTDAGKNAAAWWQQDAIGGRVSSQVDTKDVARRTLAGIDDSDAEVLDSLPFLDLSGQWADGLTDDDVLRDIFAEASTPDAFDDALEPEGRDDLIDTYRDAFDSAVVDEVSRFCSEHLREG